MAESDKIKSSDIIQSNLFANTIKSADDLDKKLEDLEERLIKVAEASAEIAKESSKSFKNADDINKVTNAIKESSKASNIASDIQKERVKLDEKLKKINEISAEQLGDITEKITRLNAARSILIKKVSDASKATQEGNERAKEAIGLTREEEKELGELTKQLFIAQSEKTKLNKTNKEILKDGENLVDIYSRESKRLNELRKQYKALRLEEGKATKETSELLKEIKRLDKELKDVDAEVGQFQRSVGDYSKQALGASKASLGWAAALIGLNGGLGDLQKGLEANEEGSKDLNNITAQASAVFNTFANRAGQATSGLIDFFKQVTTGETNVFKFGSTLNKITQSFVGVFNAAGKAADAAGKASDESFNLDRELLSLNETLVILNGEFEKQSAIAGDSTRSFNDQQKAAELAQIANIKRLAIQEDIASRELKIIEDRIAGEEDERNLFALQSEASEKRIALQEVQNELNVATIDNEKILREIQRDRFERELDFAIDAFDTQKTINERQISDDRKTIEERQAILDETIRLTDSSFKSQKQLFAEFVNDKIDFDALVIESDEAKIRSTLRLLDLDDIELGRALEVIKERKIALQDLDDAEREIFEAREERRLVQIESINELEQLQLEAEINRLNALENQTNESINSRFDLQKRALEDEADFRIQTEKLTSEEIEVINQELSNNLIELERNKTKELKAIKQQQLEDEIAIQDARISTLKSLSELSKIIAGEDEEAQKAIIATQKAIAISEIAINLQREISAIKQRNADKENGKALTAAEITAAVATAAVGTSTVLAQGNFIEGTENVAESLKGNKVHNGVDGYNINVDGRERILNPSQNMKVGDLSNNQLADIAMMYNNGQLINPFTDIGVNIGKKDKQVDNTHLLVSEIKDLKNVISNKPVQQVNVDSFGNLVEVVYKNGVKDTYTYKSKKWL